MDIDKVLAQLANAPLDHIDLSHVESGVMRGLAQTTAVIKSQTPIRLGAMTVAMIVGVSLSVGGAVSNQSRETLVSGAHLAPSASLALPS